MSIVLQLPPDRMKKILQDEGYPQLAESVGAMALNIRYDGSEVTLVTGISLKSFSLDKNADRIWDSMMERFLASREIGFEAMT
jgi:phosphate-selective porin